MKDRILPSSEQINFGNDRYEQGYKRGWDRRSYDINRLKSLKERALYLRFGAFLDFIDDKISANRKK